MFHLAVCSVWGVLVALAAGGGGRAARRASVAPVCSCGAEGRQKNGLAGLVRSILIIP